jgi:hypothetical protein
MFMSLTNIAIGAPIAMASPRGYQKLVCLHRRMPFGFRSMLPRLHGSRRAQRARLSPQIDVQSGLNAGVASYDSWYQGA